MVLGATGQIGSELILELRRRYGGENVIGVGHSRSPSPEALASGPYEIGNVLEPSRIEELCQKHDVGTIYHLAAVLSGVGEKDPQFAWDLNMNGLVNVLEIARKLDALAGHCEREGRDRSGITVSYQTVACIAPTRDEARAELDAYLASRGIDVASMGEDDAEAIRSAVAYGGPDELAEHFAGLLALGVDGFTVAAPANGHVEGRVALLGEALAPLVA